MNTNILMDQSAPFGLQLAVFMDWIACFVGYITMVVAVVLFFFGIAYNLYKFVDKKFLK